MQTRKKSISFLNDNEENTMDSVVLNTNKDSTGDNSSPDETETKIGDEMTEGKFKKHESKAASSILKKSRTKPELIEQCEDKKQKKFNFLLNKKRLIYMKPNKLSKKVHVSKNVAISHQDSSTDEIAEHAIKERTTRMISNLKPLKLSTLSNDSSASSDEMATKAFERESFTLSKVCSFAHPIYSVEIRAVVLKLGGIDTLNEKFYAEAFIEAKWIDVSKSFIPFFSSGNKIV